MTATAGIGAQYHSRPSPERRRIRDLRELIVAAAEIPVIDLPLPEIGEIDENRRFAMGSEPSVREIVKHVRLMQAATGPAR